MTMLGLALTLAAAPALVALLNSLLNRWSGTHPHKTPFQAGLIAGAIWITAWMWLCTAHFGSGLDERAWDLAFGALFLGCVVFLNWFLFTITDVSMHIQLLMQIYEKRLISKATLEEKYNKQVIISNRIPRLLELGQLKLVDGRLYVSGRGVLLGAEMCAMIRRLLGLPSRPELAQHEA